MLCLQEIKCVEGKFPELELARARLPAYRGLGAEGLSRRRHALAASVRQCERRDICGRGHARHLSVKLGDSGSKPVMLHNVYVPAGGDIPDPALNEKFRHKLDFLEAMERLVWRHARQARRTA